ERVQYLDLAYSKIKLLNRLITDLFDLSKLESQQFDFNYRQLFVHQWVYNVEEKLTLELKDANRQFTFMNEPIDKQFISLIDEERMDQVFSNLVWNAVDHTSDQNGKIDVHVNIDVKKMEIIFRFIDNGVGIKENVIPYVFDRYY